MKKDDPILVFLEVLVYILQSIILCIHKRLFTLTQYNLA